MIKKLFHLIPFVHFYSKWSSVVDSTNYGGYERQHRYCEVCNEKRYRAVENT
jgi:hypothetical protein